ncbi:GbsR/MarR family transcriptional regulator [Methanolobus psychrotolerans]|uniref:GbsR/MarR family transcriptional regulator n=1 Tax=Methanolobus psychrotolerans TaxID=1874706 RepID=UPI000B91BF0C|nr:winged helix-turn-helix transcriptional regulator [Methanolobus psychrotolerans]
MRTIRKEFEALVYRGIKSHGLDELSSKLFATLYSHPDLLTLEELSEKTGYSFSAVSAAMKKLADLHLVEKTKKAGSKKLYFSIQKDMLKLTLDQVKYTNELMVAPAIKKLPGIIERCKKSKSEESEKTLRIIEQYYREMIALDLILTNVVELTDQIQEKRNKE